MMMATCAGNCSKFTCLASASSGDPGGIQARSCSSDMLVHYKTLLVLDPDEKQAGRRRRPACLPPLARFQHVTHPRRRPAAAPDLDERADNRTDHVAEEPVGAHVVGDERLARPL